MGFTIHRRRVHRVRSLAARGAGGMDCGQDGPPWVLASIEIRGAPRDR